MAEPIPLDPERDEALIARIEALMIEPPVEGHTVKMTITPGVARHIIGNWYGSHNRREKAASIVQFAVDMGKDGWMFNGATIVFTDQCVLGDGQNRLKACIRSGRPFTTLVVFGIAHGCFFTMDQGRRRNPDDVLQIEGVVHSGAVAQAVRWAELLATRRVPQRTVFKPAEVLTLYREKHRGVADFYDEAQPIAARNSQPIGLVMALLYTFDQADPEHAAAFSAEWKAGTYSPQFRVIGTMQAELTTLKNSTVGRVHETVRTAMIINAWNVTRKGGKTGTYASVIRWTKDMPFPLIR